MPAREGIATPSIAMKVYDFQWHATFGMDAATAADALAADGVDTVLVSNQIDPLPTSGVDQKAYLAAAGRLPRADDQLWSTALKAAGLRVYQTTATFFDPAALQVFPDARPVDANGNPDRGFDWYLGVCPTHEGYLAAKIERLQRVVTDLDPDGLFLSFTRFPGFWENWVPGYGFTNVDRFCFCDRCRARFASDADVDLPGKGAATDARFILDHHGSRWTAWRCARIAEVVARIKAALRAARPDGALMLNTLPFPAAADGAIDARREIGAQDLSLLAVSIDRFELMTYLQILARTDDWLPVVLADARRLAPDRPLLCTLQVAPLYTNGVHAGRGRSPTVTADELDRSARAAFAAGADGLVFYHWTDFLVDEAAGGGKRTVLRGLGRG